MQRAHKIRLYPTREQAVQLSKTAGTARYAYNWGLATWKHLYESGEKPSSYALCKRWTKEKPEWANETSRSPQTRALLDLGIAFNKMFKGLAAYPKFHKKGRKDSFYMDNAHAYIDGRHIMLPKIGKVRMAEGLRYDGKIMSYTVSQYAGQWQVSVQVESNKDERPSCINKDSVVGVDVGLKHIATASDGTVLDSPVSLNTLQQKLKNVQRSLARKQPKSHNYTKQLQKKQLIQLKINNIRTDFVHKFTTKIAKNHGVVVVEDLDIKGMMEKADKPMRHSLALSMMSEVLRQLAYKAQALRKVDRFFPSSKMCSKCGHIKEELSLSTRTYTCEACGTSLDRDLNAAINLMNTGLVKPGEPVDSAGTR